MPEKTEMSVYDGETFDVFERKLETTLNGEGLRDVMQHFKDFNPILPQKLDGEFQKHAVNTSILMEKYSLTTLAAPPAPADGGAQVQAQPANVRIPKTGEDLKQAKKFRENLGKAYKILDEALDKSSIVWILEHDTGTDEEEKAIGFYLSLGRMKVEVDTSQNVDLIEFRALYRKLDEGIPAPEHIIGDPRFVITWKTDVMKSINKIKRMLKKDATLYGEMGCTQATFPTTIKKWVATHVRLVPVSIKSNPILAANLLATDKFMQFFHLLEENQKTQSKLHSLEDGEEATRINNVDIRKQNRKRGRDDEENEPERDQDRPKKLPRIPKCTEHRPGDKTSKSCTNGRKCSNFHHGDPENKGNKIAKRNAETNKRNGYVHRPRKGRDNGKTNNTLSKAQFRKKLNEARKQGAEQYRSKINKGLEEKHKMRAMIQAVISESKKTGSKSGDDSLRLARYGEDGEIEYLSETE
jgi:hypothetical protein